MLSKKDAERIVNLHADPTRCDLARDYMAALDKLEHCLTWITHGQPACPECEETKKMLAAYHGRTEDKYYKGE